MMIIVKLIILGLVSGIASGALGIGGGLLMVPAMVYLMHYPQHLAQGTSLAILVLPIGLLGAFRYYQSGNIQLHIIPWIALGFIVGAYLGADLIHHLNQLALKRLFGGCMLLVALKLIFTKGS